MRKPRINPQMMRYSIEHTEIKPYHAGVLINVRDKNGFVLGEIHATRANKVDVLELKEVLVACLKIDNSFEDLAQDVKRAVVNFASTLEIKYIYD